MIAMRLLEVLFEIFAILIGVAFLTFVLMLAAIIGAFYV